MQNYELLWWERLGENFLSLTVMKSLSMIIVANNITNSDLFSSSYHLLNNHMQSSKSWPSPV